MFDMVNSNKMAKVPKDMIHFIKTMLRKYN
jgi:hypothetical protein